MKTRHLTWPLAATVALTATVVLAPSTSPAHATYGVVGVIGEANTTLSAVASLQGEERGLLNLCFTFTSTGTRRLKVTVGTRIQSTVAGATADIRVRRDTLPAVCSSPTSFDYQGAVPVGGTSGYMVVPGGAGAVSMTTIAEEVPPAGTWTYRATLTKTAGPGSAVVTTGQTGYAPQFLLVEDIGLP